MQPASLFSTITTPELQQQFNLLKSKIEFLRIKVLKDCDELEPMLNQILVLEKELKERNDAK